MIRKPLVFIVRSHDNIWKVFLSRKKAIKYLEEVSKKHDSLQFRIEIYYLEP